MTLNSLNEYHHNLISPHKLYKVFVEAGLFIQWFVKTDQTAKMALGHRVHISKGSLLDLLLFFLQAMESGRRLINDLMTEQIAVSL